MLSRYCRLSALFIASLTLAKAAEQSWQELLKKDLPLLGHRNWIVVADSAYPLQTAPGIETVFIDANELDVVKGVISELAKSRHVRAAIYTDTELNYVAENNSPGISVFRASLNNLLAHEKTQALPHEQIISKIDEAGKTFKILLIKTNLTMPYTSVFFQLECGYWNDQAEAELRSAINKSK